MKEAIRIMSFVTFILLTGCLKVDEPAPTEEQLVPENLVEEGPMTGMNVSDNFNFDTAKSSTISLIAPDFLKGAGFSLHLTSEANDSIPFASASFGQDGRFSEYFELPTSQDSITIRSNYVGLTDMITVPLENGNVHFDYRPLYEREDSVSGKSLSVTKKGNDTFEQDGFTFLSPYDGNGVPDNLVAPDIIQQNLLDDINASLPENQKLPNSHPEYLAGKETNIVLKKEADVWVTFVGEGAGWRNALGYYTYPIGQEPTSVEEIDTHYIIFPNISMKNSGGGLSPGDRVLLGRFPANSVVSRFLVANGYNGNGIGEGNGTHYSQPELNAENDPDLKKHMVVLYDTARELAILAFEDVPRDWPSCDQDFNDAIFYAKSNPVDAIVSSNLAAIDTANDADGDGINDELDYFPFDPDVAFNNFAPSANSNGTLAYEDLWPSKGDYDFNDLVVAYNYNLLANADGNISRIEATYTIEHIGAAFHNGFAISFPFSPSNIESVENQILDKQYLNIQANGTEAGTAADETVIVIADDTFDLLGTELNIEITFSNPVAKESLGRVPFNPFIIVNGVREREVHLPDLEPTSKAQFLGDKDDYSDRDKNRFYKTEKNLPWALNIYDAFDPPQERVPIIMTYPKFVPWANSGGTNEQTWYIR